MFVTGLQLKTKEDKKYIRQLLWCKNPFCVYCGELTWLPENLKIALENVKEILAK